MGFRSDGTCTVCGHETSNEYVCDGCARRTNMKDGHEIFEGSIEDRIRQLDSDINILYTRTKVALDAANYAGVEKFCQMTRGKVEEIIKLKARLKTYTLELSYDEIKCIIEAMKGGQYSIVTRDSIEAKIRKMVN